MRQVWCVLAVVGLAGLPSAGRADDQDDEVNLVDRAQPSIALLRVFRAGGDLEAAATGFMIQSPDRAPRIVTSAHIFRASHPTKGVVMVTYMLPEMIPKFLPCESVQIDEAHDLAMLKPHPRYPIRAPSLPLFSGKVAPPKFAKVVLIGSPGGLAWTPEVGKLNAEPLTITEMAKQRLVSPEEYGKLDGELRLWRHNTYSTPGYSGSPLLTLDGQVLGVHLGTLPKAANVGFAVHADHIRKFDWSQPDRDLLKQPIISDAPGIAALAQQADRRPEVAVRVGNQEYDFGCYHLGYVPADAEFVITKYVQDKTRFTQYFTEDRLAAILKTTRLAHLTNPVLGFRLLVPKGFSYTTTPTTEPAGVRLTFTHPNMAAATPPYNKPLTVWAIYDPKRFAYARGRLRKAVATGEVTYTPDEIDSPALKGRHDDGFVTGYVMATTTRPFAAANLKVRIQSQGEVYGLPGDPVFIERKSFTTHGWMRANYDEEQGSAVHAVHVGVKEPVVVLVHYEVTKEDRAAFIDGKPVNPIYTDYALIASTVSLY